MGIQTENIVEIADMSVRYGSKTAVQGLSLQLKRGQSLGLLGLNGAGKTTTIRTLLGMVKPDSGTVSVFGGRPGLRANLAKTGFAPEDGIPPDFLTTSEYLEFVYGLKNPHSKDKKKDCLAILDWFELSAHKRIQDLSKGMNRRLILAQAFLGSPDFLILDEPLNGLDPLMIIKLRDKLEAFRAAGGTVLYCSHILSEVERSCSDVLILREGTPSYSRSVAGSKSEYGDIESVFAKFAGHA